MNATTRETIQDMIFYYDNHDMTVMLDDSKRLRNFVTDDFTKLLALLEEELK